uniref:LRRNT domain-containing protein n=1 Tax=Clastoptera arizonana TaxID=38151 RepID=A0A1B6CQQ4_9HEMI
MEIHLVFIVIFAYYKRATATPCPFPCLCNLLSINCSSQKLTSFPMYFPSNIYQLDLSDNSISFLPNSLKDLNEVVTLNLAKNNIQELITSSMSSLQKLQKLDLSMNRIANTMSINSLNENYDLYHLNISGNPIRDLGNSWETILHSSSISHLDLSNCALSLITDHLVFTGLTNLTYLTLSGNPLKNINKLTSLTLSHLDLSSCSLFYLQHKIFADLPSLQDLNLSRNPHLTMLTRYIKKDYLMSASLLYLDASFCALDQVDLEGFPNLIHASLKGNLIKILPDRILENNKNLVSLDLSENSIYHLDSFAFVGAESLFSLDLSLNSLPDIYWSTFLQTPFLKYLNLSKNVLTSLKNLTAPSIVSLDLSKNYISTMSPTSLINMPELITLNLSHNSIEMLPVGLKTMSLQNLDLRFCRISILNELTFENLPSLRSLDLSGNRLTNPMKQNLLTHLSNLKEINLINNPWQCNCYNKDFKMLWVFLTEPIERSKQLDKLTCQSPENSTGLTWKESCFKELNDENKSKFRERPWVSLLITFVSLSCILSIMIVIRQAFQVRDIERRQQEINEAQYDSVQRRRSRIVDNLYEEHLEIALHRSQNDLQRSPIAELSKLPSYEEALLLPKPSSNKDLQGLVDKYEQTDRFEHQYESIDEARPSSSLNCRIRMNENIIRLESQFREQDRHNETNNSVYQIPLDYTTNTTQHHYDSINEQERTTQNVENNNFIDEQTAVVEPVQQLYSSIIRDPGETQRHHFGITRSRSSSRDSCFTILDPKNIQISHHNESR